MTTKIAFIHPSYPSSEGTGATHSATQIVDCLADSPEFEVTCFCRLSPPANSNEKLLGYNCEFIQATGFPPHTGIQLNKALINMQNKFIKYDVLHSYLPVTIPAINQISANKELSTAVSLNAYKSICPKNDMLLFNKTQCKSNGLLKCILCSSVSGVSRSRSENTRRVISRFGNLNLIREINPQNIQIDAFHALSDTIKQSYINHGYPQNKIKIIPNIPDKIFRVKHSSSFSEPYKLLYVGYLKNNKGVDLFPEILSILDEISDVEFKLTIVGTGEEKHALDSGFKKYDVENLVTMKGHVRNSNLPQIYAEHDLFIYPGRWDEPFGRVFIESLSAGTPVLGADVGNVKEIIGNAGVVCSPDPLHIAHQIDCTLDQSRLIKLHKNTKKELEKFDRRQLCEKFNSFFYGVTESG